MPAVTKKSVLLGLCLALGAWACGPKEPTHLATHASAEPTPTDDAWNGSGPMPANDNDAPEISRSVGEEGGVVVFWPRVIPRTSDPETRELAKAVQDKLVELVKQALPGRAVDVRPEPERVCPRDGCAGSTVGALLTKSEGGCVVLGLVAPAGKGDTHIVAWGGAVKLASETVAFRDLPEGQVTVRDHVRCTELLDKAAAKDAALVEAIAASVK